VHDEAIKVPVTAGCARTLKGVIRVVKKTWRLTIELPACQHFLGAMMLNVTSGLGILFYADLPMTKFAEELRAAIH
jgi:hypothetical protein